MSERQYIGSDRFQIGSGTSLEYRFRRFPLRGENREPHGNRVHTPGSSRTGGLDRRVP